MRSMLCVTGGLRWARGGSCHHSAVGSNWFGFGSVRSSLYFGAIAISCGEISIREDRVRLSQFRSGKVGSGFRVRCITFSSFKSLVLRCDCGQTKSWIRKDLEEIDRGGG